MSKLNPVVPATAAVATIMVIALSVAVIGTSSSVGAATLCVTDYASPAFYTTIQAAIDAAGEDDLIKISQGTYTETLIINDNITLQGGWSQECTTRVTEDPQFTIVDGGGTGSVVSISSDSTVTLDGLTVTNGHAQKGGGVHVSGASATLDNMVVTGNVISPTGPSFAQWAYGGGVYVYEGTVTLTNCQINYNTSDPSSSDICFGGGLALESEALDPAIAFLENTQIMSNSNPSHSDPDGSTLYGGGLYLDPQSQVTFEGTDNLIAYNESRAGGGVYMYGDVDLEGVMISDNFASMDGGGIFIASGFEGGRISNNYLLRNNADRDGDSIVASDVDLEIANNTVVGDSGSSGAGIEVIDTGNGVAELVNNIVVNHTIGIKISDIGAADTTLSHNDVWNNTANYQNVSAGSSDIGVDPEFVDPGNDDYHLDTGSPCVNAGTYLDWLFFDYDGDRRTGTLLDIGADEYGSDYLSFVPTALKAYAP
jgi:hypothetical protein